MIDDEIAFLKEIEGCKIKLAELRVKLDKAVAERDEAREWAREREGHDMGCSAGCGNQYRCRCSFDEQKKAMDSWA